MSCGIYRFQNQITLESYVGQSANLEERYKRHHRDWVNGTTDFYEAIQEWGWNNFSYEILELCEKEELNNKEKYWITVFDSFYNGYNETKGGGKYWTVDENEILKLYHNGLSPKQIKVQLQISLSTVYKYLSYDKEFIKNKDNNKNINFCIYQYDLNGNFIKSWLSRKAAARVLNIYNTSIGKAISGERISAGGFLWQDYYIKQLPKEQIKPIWHKHKVNQYDKDCNYIQTFESYVAAAQAVNGDRNLIKRTCQKGFNYSAYGYKWKLTNE